MGCSYYTYRGGYYCMKKQENVNEDVYSRYCRGYYYSDCPIYKDEPSSGGCYLTSACTFSKGLPDDCYELETLRSYRDNWLANSDEGKALIKEYYNVAPKIVSNINERKEKKDIYEMIYKEMVNPCVELIEQNKNKECLELYKKMTLYLNETYC